VGIVGADHGFEGFAVVVEADGLDADVGATGVCGGGEGCLPGVDHSGGDAFIEAGGSQEVREGAGELGTLRFFGEGGEVEQETALGKGIAVQTGDSTGGVVDGFEIMDEDLRGDLVAGVEQVGPDAAPMGEDGTAALEGEGGGVELETGADGGLNEIKEALAFVEQHGCVDLGSEPGVDAQLAGRVVIGAGVVGDVEVEVDAC